MRASPQLLHSLSAHCARVCCHCTTPRLSAQPVSVRVCGSAGLRLPNAQKRKGQMKSQRGENWAEPGRSQSQPTRPAPQQQPTLHRHANNVKTIHQPAIWSAHHKTNSNHNDEAGTVIEPTRQPHGLSRPQRRRCRGFIPTRCWFKDAFSSRPFIDAFDQGTLAYNQLALVSTATMHAHRCSARCLSFSSPLPLRVAFS